MKLRKEFFLSNISVIYDGILIGKLFLIIKKNAIDIQTFLKQGEKIDLTRLGEIAVK